MPKKTFRFQGTNFYIPMQREDFQCVFRCEQSEAEDLFFPFFNKKLCNFLDFERADFEDIEEARSRAKKHLADGLDNLIKEIKMEIKEDSKFVTECMFCCEGKNVTQDAWIKNHHINMFDPKPYRQIISPSKEIVSFEIVPFLSGEYNAAPFIAKPSSELPTIEIVMSTFNQDITTKNKELEIETGGTVSEASCYQCKIINGEGILLQEVRFYSEIIEIQIERESQSQRTIEKEIKKNRKPQDSKRSQKKDYSPSEWSMSSSSSVSSEPTIKLTHSFSVLKSPSSPLTNDTTTKRPEIEKGNMKKLISKSKKISEHNQKIKLVRQRNKRTCTEKDWSMKIGMFMHLTNENSDNANFILNKNNFELERSLNFWLSLKQSQMEKGGTKKEMVEVTTTVRKLRRRKQ